MQALPRLLRLFSVPRAPGGLPVGVRPGTRRKAPRAVLWGFAIFALIQLAIGVASELYPRIRDPLYGDKKVKLARRIATDGDRPTTVVMLGSSRTGLAFHGLRVEERMAANLGRPAVAFNMGVPASGPVTHLVYLKRLVDDGITPDVVVLEVMPSMLADRAEGPLEQNWFYADRLRYREQDIVIRHGFPSKAVHERWWKSSLLPAYTMRFQLLTRIAPSWLPWQLRFDWSRGTDECGWGLSANQNPTEEQRTKGFTQARAEYAPILANLQPGGAAVDALREIVVFCKAKDIPLRLVMMPESSGFRELLPPQGEERLNAFLAKFTAEHGIPPVVNARAWLDDSMFWDGHHMLKNGAETFSDRLTDEAIIPAVSGGSQNRR